jgi:hypothetical protein
MLTLLPKSVFRLSVLGLIFLLPGCPSGEPPADDDDSSPAEEMEHLFDFVIIADPHIAGPVAHEERLASAIVWINEHRDEYGIDLTLVLGDIGWGEGLQPALGLLEVLSMPFVPVMGDNVVAYGGEADFETTFAPTFDSLATELEGWERAALPVWHDTAEADAWLQNTRFEHKGVLFISQDWNVRDATGIMAEFGEFNDVAGGSWEWLANALQGAENRPDESVLVLSHVPMAPVSFDLEERGRFATLIAPIRDKVYANFAGHLHVDYEEDFPEDGYSTFVTDATWDDAINLRRVSVFGDGQQMTYQQHAVVVEP